MIKPKLSTIRSIAKANKVTKGAVLVFLDEDGTYAYASYGVTKAECGIMCRFGDDIIDLIHDRQTTPY